VTLHPRTLYSPLTNGIINIKFENEQVFLDTLFFRLNGGSILTRGSTMITKGNVVSLAAQVEVDRVRMNRPKEFNLTVQSIQAGVKMEGEIILLEGDVILGESHLLKDVRPKSLLPFFRKVERPISTPPDLLRKTRLDVRIRESNKLWIDNNVAHLRLHSELGLIGTLAQPNIAGRVTVEEGYVLYLDRKFLVEKGVLDFADPHRINPIVEFKSNADIKSYQTWSKQPYTVSLSIQGPLDQAVMDLTSNPPLDRSDILSLLTVGATKDQMIGRDETGKTSLADVLQDRAGHLSSRQVSGFTSRRVGYLLGLEEMSIEGNLFRFGKSWGPQLLASKKITERMEISYTTRVGHANEQSIRLDYRLSKVLSLEGTTDQQGRSGIDLKLRWKFR
jgi:autotransporter translocation and assembly factor TamB